jgi:hypothetical protein
VPAGLQAFFISDKGKKKTGRKGEQIGNAAPGATFRAQVDVCGCHKWANKMLGSNFDF